MLSLALNWYVSFNNPLLFVLLRYPCPDLVVTLLIQIAPLTWRLKFFCDSFLFATLHDWVFELMSSPPFIFNFAVIECWKQWGKAEMGNMSPVLQKQGLSCGFCVTRELKYWSLSQFCGVFNYVKVVVLHLKFMFCVQWLDLKQLHFVSVLIF